MTLNARNLALAALALDRPVEHPVLKATGYSGVWVSGQSNGDGSHAAAVTINGGASNFQLGDSPCAQADETYSALGGANIRPLANSAGETPEIAFCAELRRELVLAGRDSVQLFAGNGAKGGVGAIVPGYESDMPAFEGMLSDAEIAAVLAWIKNSWPERQRGFQAEVTANDGGGS